MKRLFSTWMLCLFSLAACTGQSSHLFLPPSDPDRALFLKGLEELKVQDASPTLSALAQRSEPGAWQERAQTLLFWQERVRTREQSSIAGFENQLRSCRNKNEILSQENVALRQDLQELKRIMVEMEKRGK